MLRQLATAVLIASTLTLASCKGLTDIATLLPRATVSITNPVTPERLYKAENAVIVAVNALNVWKTRCARGQIAQTCKAQVANVQFFTRKLAAALPELRQFVRDNDQINAVTVFKEMMELYEDAKAQAPAGVIPPNPAS